MYGKEYAHLQTELKTIEARLMAGTAPMPQPATLAQIPGIGAIGATTLVMKAPDPRLFPSGRHIAARIGLTPKDHSTRRQDPARQDPVPAMRFCTACWWRERPP